MVEGVVAVALLAVLGDRVGIPATAATCLAAYGAGYMASCWWRPWVNCSNQECYTRRPFDTNDRGHVRRRFQWCWTCWGRGPRIRRLGAVLIGRGLEK